eukprot:6864884-Pyramimonas_sp.AAC.1
MRAQLTSPPLLRRTLAARRRENAACTTAPRPYWPRVATWGRRAACACQDSKPHWPAPTVGAEEPQNDERRGRLGPRPSRSRIGPANKGPTDRMRPRAASRIGLCQRWEPAEPQSRREQRPNGPAHQRKPHWPR